MRRIFLCASKISPPWSGNSKLKSDEIPRKFPVYQGIRRRDEFAADCIHSHSKKPIKIGISATSRWPFCCRNVLQGVVDKNGRFPSVTNRCILFRATRMQHAVPTLCGELVLLSSAIDALLNETLIEVLRLGKSTFLLPVIATLEPSRKLEILKERAKHIKNPTWKKGIEKFVGTVESVFKFRNIACHSVPVFEKGQWALKPIAAAKMLRGLDLPSKSLKRTAFDELRSAIANGEKALGEGTLLIENFRRFNATINALRSDEEAGLRIRHSPAAMLRSRHGKLATAGISRENDGTGTLQALFRPCLE